MKFYSELSRVYDIVFPLDENTLNFLMDGIKLNCNALDLACGTGEYTIALGKEGHRVIGVDLNHGMIELAHEKTPASIQVEFFEEDMTRLEVFGKVKQDLIFCIGNSVVHLNDKMQISKFIEDIYNKLSIGGRIVIQTINFNRIIKYKIDSLPTIIKQNGDIKFIRNYLYKEGDTTLDFSTELVIRENGIENTYTNRVPLIILLKDEMFEMLQNAGFRNINVYGSFDRSEYTDESYALIIEAKKIL